MFAAISLLLLVPAFEGTSTGIAQNSDPSCLLQMSDQVLAQFHGTTSTLPTGDEEDAGEGAGDAGPGCAAEDPVENVCPAGQMCGCGSNVGPPPGGPFLQYQPVSACKDACVGKPAFVYRENNLANGGTQPACWCCDSVEPLDIVPPSTYWVRYEVYACDTGAADLEGDPHIKTLDGRHYTLLRQGTYSLWHFSGVDAHVSQGGQVNKVPVDWHIYSHYS